MLAFLNFFTLLILGIAAAAVIIATPINLIFELDWFDSPINLILILLWSILLSGIFQMFYFHMFYCNFKDVKQKEVVIIKTEQKTN